MAEQPRFLPASSFTLEAFAEVFTRSFEGYFYAAQPSAQDLAWRVRLENLDLYRSLVMLVGDQPAGMALLGVRGDRAWCGGFGVARAFRGRGLSHHLATALVDQARQAGVRVFLLEVLTRNAPAIATYRRAGLQVWRELLILEWQRSQPVDPPSGDPAVIPASPERLLEHFRALHGLPAAWQRDLPSLLVRGGLHGLAIMERDAPAAYVLFQIRDGSKAHIVDLGARRAEHVAALLQTLQSRSTELVSVNEPADSPFIPTFLAAGFAETDRQYEMTMDLR